jgi:hyperosmotically inducible protein
MRKDIRAVIGLVGLALCVGSAGASAQMQGKLRVEEIRQALLKLPYYGVFDFMAFSYDRGTVTLAGYAYHPGLKGDAERAVKRVPGVDQVKNQIEDLPPNPMDDEVRWKTYYKIYGDPFLSRYAPGGGLLWGMHHTFGPDLLNFGGTHFPGMEPAGDYPIHIIVKNLHVLLFGVVDNATDKQVAEMRAREVSGSFGVENNLMVYNESKSTKR